MDTNTEAARINAFREEWASGIWQQQVKPDVRAEWQRHLGNLGLEIGQFQNTDVLEIGCGATGVSYYLPQGGRRIGVDPAAPSLERWNVEAGDRHPIELLNTGAEQLNFPDDSFDTVFCINCLDHTSDPTRIVSEIHRVLRPGGEVILHYDIDSPIRKLRKRLRPLCALMHPHSLTYQWTCDNILNNSKWTSHVTYRDLIGIRESPMLSEPFLDNLIYRFTGWKRFINHLWIRSSCAK